MNVSLATTATPGTPGAAAKAGKGGDPLADFMAMLGQLGIAIEGEGAPAAATTTVPTGTQDIAAKLLAKLGKKAGDAKDMPSDPASEQKADDAEPGDPVTTLADLLAQIDPKAAQGAEPAKLDVATLIAAVRAIATHETKGKADEGAASVASTVSAAPAQAGSSIASLLARTARAAAENAPVAPSPDMVDPAFARLEALVGGKGTEGKIAANATDVATPANDDATGTQSKSSARLTEMLARLADAPKPASTQQQAPANPATPVARPPSDPQMAAVAEAIQQAFGDDKPVKGSANQLTDGSVAGISASAPAPAATAIGPTTDVAQTSVSDDLARHHLDITKDSQWLDTLARDIARAAQHDTQLRFQLNPEHLGSLKVELVNGANGTSVKLTADTEAARAILADAQPRLVAEARAQGLRISEAHVDLSGQGSAQRHAAETPVIVRTGNGAAAELDQDMPVASGERYA